MIEIPHRRQAKPYTCGPACLRMVLAAFGKAVTEADISDAVGCTAETGTSPANMARYLRKAGFVARSRSMRNLADIKADISRGFPVIVAYQAWAQGVDLANTLDHGHYAIITAVDDERVTLCARIAKTKRHAVPRAEFIARWRDVDSNSNHYPRWALTVRPKT